MSKNTTKLDEPTSPAVTKSEKLLHIKEFAIDNSFRIETLKGFEAYAKGILGKLYNTSEGWQSLYNSYITRKI
jgi:hypothetical protein